MPLNGKVGVRSQILHKSDNPAESDSWLSNSFFEASFESFFEAVSSIDLEQKFSIRTCKKTWGDSSLVKV